jgi:hypothetical protein
MREAKKLFLLFVTARIVEARMGVSKFLDVLDMIVT